MNRAFRLCTSVTVATAMLSGSLPVPLFSSFVDTALAAHSNVTCDKTSAGIGEDVHCTVLVTRPSGDTGATHINVGLVANGPTRIVGIAAHPLIPYCVQGYQGLPAAISANCFNFNPYAQVPAPYINLPYNTPIPLTYTIRVDSCGTGARAATTVANVYGVNSPWSYFDFSIPSCTASSSSSSARPIPTLACNDGRTTTLTFGEGNFSTGPETPNNPQGTVLSTQYRPAGITFEATNGGMLRISKTSITGGDTGASGNPILAINSRPQDVAHTTTAILRFVDPATGQPATVPSNSIRFHISDTNPTPSPRVIMRTFDRNGQQLEEQTLNSLSANVQFSIGDVNRIELIDNGGDGHTFDDLSYGPLNCNTPQLSQCNDGVDNDYDGLVDFGQDPGCSSPTDNDESNNPPQPPQCTRQPSSHQLYSDGTMANSSWGTVQLGGAGYPATVRGFQSNGGNPGSWYSIVPSLSVKTNCSSPTRTESILGTWFKSASVNPATESIGTVTINFDVNYNYGSQGTANLQNVGFTAYQDGRMYILTQSAAITGLQWQHRQFSVSAATLTAKGLDLSPSGSPIYFGFLMYASCVAPNSVNGFDNVRVDVTSACPQSPAQCSDGIDNDYDGATDANDFSCSNPEDDDETNPKAQCQDGIDNDNDGKVDFPQDPGCTSKQDNDEYNQPAPQCSDGIDNDGDGKIDMQDPGCTSPNDNDEYNQPAPQCSDGVDNDNDTKVDYFDPGCYLNGQYNPNDNDETDPQTPQCSDGLDNDYDGATDSNDFSCSSPNDNDETNPKAQCQDGIDNDNDGKVDFPQDPGCTSKQDNDEYNQPAPQCSDGIDNDGDGKIDMQDPGCTSPNDNDEYNQPAPQCSDGVDNDNDTKVDYFDPGCYLNGQYNPNDNDETDPVAQVGCVIITKRTTNTAGQNLTPVAQFTFRLDGQRTTANDGAGYAIFTNVTPGQHTVSEDVPAGWTVSPSASQYVNVNPGTNCAQVAFNNMQNPVGGCYWYGQTNCTNNTNVNTNNSSSSSWGGWNQSSSSSSNSWSGWDYWGNNGW